MLNIHKSISLSIAHINDTHSYFEPVSLALNLNVDGLSAAPYVSTGGFARIKTRAEQLREEAHRQNKGFLFLHAGDCFQGTLYFSLFKGEANARLLNALNIDAMTVGNHELDLGNELLASFAQNINFPLMAGNWDLSRELHSKPIRLDNNPQVMAYDASHQRAHWLEKDIDGERIALFGLSLDKMEEISNPDSDTPFVDAGAVAAQTVDAIHASGINKIIVLSHLGYEADKTLAQNVDGIGLIVGGHSHVLQGDFSDLGLKAEEPYGVRVNDTYIVQAGYYGQALGHCTIDFDPEGNVVGFSGSNTLLLGRRLFLDADRQVESMAERYQDICDYIDRHPLLCVCKKSTDIQNILYQDYLPLVREKQQRKITHLGRPLRHIRIPDEYGGSEVAPYVAKSFVAAATRRGYHVDFAIHNAGGIRCSLEPGDIAEADIAGKLLPFAIPIGVYAVTGETVMKILEGAMNNALNMDGQGTGSGSYPYCYGLNYIYDVDAEEGKRITQLNLYRDGEWQPVDINSVYYGVSSAYTAKGKEGYDAILHVVKPYIPLTISMADALIESLVNQPSFFESENVLPTVARSN